MKRLLLQLFAISSFMLLAAGAYGGSRPRYGGTVRILLHDRVLSIDPLSDEDRPAARDRMAALAFENLTAIDAQGRLRPELAVSWHADQSKRGWRFSMTEQFLPPLMLRRAWRRAIRRGSILRLTGRRSRSKPRSLFSKCRNCWLCRGMQL